MATTSDTSTQTAVHGGRLVARALRSRGVEHLFTLSGGHLFSIYDGCREEGIEIVDVRHEQAAVWAAEGYAKATRRPGVAALTAGPGVTNGMSAIAGALYNRSPVTVLGGRAPEMRWGSGSLQEVDHVPFVAPLVKSAETVKDPAPDRRAPPPPRSTARSPPPAGRPSSTIRSTSSSPRPRPTRGEDPGFDPGPVADGVEEAAELLGGRRAAAIMAGTGLYWARGEDELRALAEALGAPVFLNGMGRGCLPADHELAFSRARGHGLKQADVALAIGLPLDFRLGFGGSFGEETKLVWLDVAPNELDRNRKPDVELVGGIAPTLAAIREAATGADPARTRPWVDAVRASEEEKREAERAELDDERAPLHPMRVYKGLAEVLDRDAIVIGDGGDFVSYAGKVVETHQPGVLDGPGPVRLPRRRPGPGDRREARPPGPPGLPAAGRRRVRLLGARVRHDGPPRHPRRRRDRQQRHLGARAPPDEVPLRLLGRRRAAARDPLRPGRRGARLPRRAGVGAGRAGARRSSARSSPASRRSSTSSPTPRSSTRASRTWPRPKRARPCAGR